MAWFYLTRSCDLLYVLVIIELKLSFILWRIISPIIPIWEHYIGDRPT